ncbi:hypothetical protein [Pseudomonas sp. MWU15-20650]|uniref:hypothetical protein n=1 Tax=Pseudomonas sp. MWU15-20650 TaxID=2933107 RepID=UPI00200D972B|nr:hypothetical protein [Pseudomonas sp. MWU15-20650]
MTDIPKLDKDVEKTETITASAPSTTPTKMTVEGGYAPWGFSGKIELEYSLVPGSSKILVRTLRYFLGASYPPEYSKFSIELSGVRPLEVSPRYINAWETWGSGDETISKTFTALFIFQAMPGGPTATDRKIITLPII